MRYIIILHLGGYMNATRNFFYISIVCSVVSVFAQHTYTINLMWINNELIPEQQFIYPTNSLTELETKFLHPIVQWSNLNPKAVIHIWFDSATTSDNAVSNTWNLLVSKIEQLNIQGILEFLDIRELPLVQQHPDIFSEKTPIYFRVDLLRAISAMHMIRAKETPCFVYADLDVKPLAEEELFDQETIAYLQKYGIVMAHSERHGFENSFQIISNHNKFLIEAMSWALIELNVRRAYNGLHDDFYYRNTTQKMPFPPTIVYESYPSMFDYFYSLAGWGSLYTVMGIENHRNDRNNHLRKRAYDKKCDGLVPFGLHTFKWDLFFDPNTINDSLVTENNETWIPTKKIIVPPSRFDD